MGKHFSIIIITTLILAGLVAAEELPVKRWWESNTVQLEEFPFSLATSPTQLDNTNWQNGILFGIDFTAKTNCNKAQVKVFIDDPKGALVESVAPYSNFWKTDNGPIKAGQTVQSTYRFKPTSFVEGTWKVRSYLYCFDTRTHIQEGSDDATTFQMVNKAGGCTCTEGFVGIKFCSDSYRYIMQPYRTCPNGPTSCAQPVENRIVAECSSNGRCDPSGPKCVQACKAETLNVYCQGSELWKNYRAADCTESSMKEQDCPGGCEVDKCLDSSGNDITPDTTPEGFSWTGFGMAAAAIVLAYLLVFRRKK